MAIVSRPTVSRRGATRLNGSCFVHEETVEFGPGKESPEIAERLMTPAAVRLRGGRVLWPAGEVGVVNPPALMTRSSAVAAAQRPRENAAAQVRESTHAVAIGVSKRLEMVVSVRPAPADIPGACTLRESQ
jgi:hypothetical protein